MKTNTKHLPEPWPADLPDEARVMTLTLVDYRRACACVNACAGIANFPSEGLKAAMLDSAIAWQTAIGERDEAIETIRELLAMLDGQMPLNTKRAYDVIKAAS